jgi:hypothetical protein
MGDEQIGLGVGIKSTADNTGFDTAAKGAKGTEDALKGAGTAADTAKTAFTELAGALGLMVGLAEIISFFKDAAEEAYKEERALRGVAQAALIFGGDMGKAKEEANLFTSALSIQTGVMKDELLDAYSKVYLATGKVTEAQKETTLAANLAAVRHIDMATALRLVESAATGVPGRFDRIVGGVTEGTTAMEKHESMTRRLISAYGDVSKVTDDAAMATDRAARRWDEFKDMVGGPVLGAMGKFKDALALFPRTLTLISDLSVVWADTVKAKAGAVAEFLLTVWKGPTAAFAVYAAETEAIETKRDAEIKKAYAQNIAEQKAMDKAATIAKVTELGFRGKDEEKAAKDKEKLLDETARYDMKAYYAMLDAEEKAYAKHVEWIVKEQRKLQTETQKYLDDSRTAEENMQKKVRELVKQTLAVKKAAAKEELKMQVEVANATIGLMVDVFGQSKELSIVQAIINTYEGATKALAQGGIYGAVLAAIVIAAGLAQIANIESAAPASSGAGVNVGGAGFDDPANDQAAYMGGRKWANDMIGKFSSGVSQGWASGMGAGGSTTNNSTTNIHVAGGLIDPNSREWMKQFGRKLALSMQSDSQRTIARRT